MRRPSPLFIPNSIFLDLLTFRPALNFKETYNGMVRSDYYKDGQAPQYYADLAFDFLEDKDAPEGKAKRYYLAMHCVE